MSPREVVVLGYGMAGARFADEVRRRDPDGTAVRLTVLGAEPHAAYNRVLLSAVVAGTMRPDMVRLHEPDWGGRHRVHLRTAVTATRIDRRSRTVELADGSRTGYDSLVLATGADPWFPPVEGLTEAGAPAEGVVGFRTLDDCARIVDTAGPGTPVAVLGGGLLGLEAARGLAGRGNPVTVVHPEAHLMERQLDAGAGHVLAMELRRLGVDVRLNTGAASFLPGDGLKLDDGSYVPAGLVVVAAGVRPATGLAADAGLRVDRGVLVDDRLRTSDERVHAIGDCASHPGTVTGLVQPAWDQAAVLADLLTGADPAARYRGTPAVTRLKARGIDLATLGETHTELTDASAEVLSFADPAGGRYAKLVLRQNRITGAIVLGLPDAAATVVQLYDRAEPVPRDRLAVLLGRALPGPAETVAPAELPDAALVCRCNSVRKSGLVRAWQAGARDVPSLAAETRATTGCGGCADLVTATADWLATR